MLKGHLDMLLLAAVQAGPVHGYAIIEALRDRSRGVIDLAEGTAYPALHRLEREGLLRSEWAQAADLARRRRVYALTAAGRRELARQQQSWHRFSQGVEAVLAGGVQ